MDDSQYVTYDMTSEEDNKSNFSLPSEFSEISKFSEFAFSDNADNSSFIPLNSQYDILIEMLLIFKHNIVAHGKYNGIVTDCVICSDPLHDTYAFEFPCDSSHVFHRQCVILNILGMIDTYNRPLHQCPCCKSKYI